MKKIDLHIHTIATRFDRKGFTFSIDILERYIQEAHLDAIAITNHEPPLKGVVCSGPIRPRGAGSV